MSKWKLTEIKRLCETEIMEATRFSRDGFPIEEVTETAKRARFVREAYRQVMRIIDSDCIRSFDCNANDHSDACPQR